MSDFLSVLKEQLGLNVDDEDLLLAQENVMRFKLHSTQNANTSLAQKARLWHHLNGKASNYYWHFETPQINLDTLEGRLLVEEDMSDEWFFVNQVLKYTAEMDQDCIAELEDSDGEFLLIECAHDLPEWVEPETVTNRSFIYRGKLHLIPLELGTDIETPEQGVEIVRANSDKTEASSRIQDTIAKRINLSGVDKSIHTAKVVLPVKVAQVLRADPRLLAYAVYAFTNRDEEVPELSTRFINKDEQFDTVQMMIPFTRCLYAQLYQQGFSKTPIEALKRENTDPDYNAYDIGTKITLGLDILYQDNPELWIINVLQVQKLMQETKFESDEAYQAFTAELKEIKYLHTEEDEDARRELFVIMHHNLDSQSLPMATYIDEILAQPSVEEQSAEQLQALLPEIKPDDDLAWMGDESELEQMMQLKLQQQRDNSEEYDDDDDEEAQMRQFADMFLRGMGGFMQGESGMEGVDPAQMEELMKQLQGTGLVGDFYPGQGDDEEDGEEVNPEMLRAYSMMDSELLGFPGLGAEREQMHDPEFLMQQLLMGHRAEADMGGVGPLNTMMAGMGMHLPQTRFEEVNDEDSSDEEL